MNTVVIAGAGLAGSRCAETLRARGFSGRVVLVGEEDLPPYERPALSKGFLAGAKRIEDLALRPTSFWDDHGIELVLGRRVVGVRPVAVLSDGRELRWDRFVVATGARARRLPFDAPDGVHLLRSVTDAAALRLRLRPGARLVIVGGGFVGAEVASTARDLGVDVAMLEAEAAPFLRLFGREVGELLASRYRAAGVALRTASQAAGFRSDSRGRVSAVQLADGSEAECDIVLVAVGAEPVRGLVGAAPRDLLVCGDAAGGAGHWTSAAWSGGEVACRLLGVEPPPPQPSYFWSDQFGLRVQLVGDPRGATTVDVEGGDDRFVGLYRDGDGRLVAGLAANRPDQIAPLRRQLALAA